jgi:tRNA nucleotidyltransferase (CCA-adding enzyme)
MVGGTVRDLLLHRPNDDIDFVTEEDAIVFANSLCRTFGGETSSFRPFGTAKWLLSQEVAASLGIDSGSLPHHIDFSSSRNEFYEHPTALPTVYTGSIKLDLQRRDFTINTIAIQMSPPASMWRILDFYGGMKDLREGLIRALHSLSFVDDPTRILRAVRFEGRLGFQIETRTTELIDTALPMLQRVTGIRLRSELTLLLREEGCEEGLLKLQNRGVLRSIHPAFAVQPNIGEHFDAARSLELPWPMPEPDRTDLLWHIVMSAVPVEPLGDLCQRLMLGRHITRSILDTARLTQTYNGLAEPDIRPSQVVKRLDEVTKLALLVTWLMIDNTLARERIQRYMLDWRHIKTVATGHTLRAMGLRPGPRFRVILERLREARLDGEITSDSEEKQRLQQLVDEEVPDDGA